MSALKDLNFIDLYIGDDFAEIKGMQGSGAFLTELPDDYKKDANLLKNECKNVHTETNKTEFSVKHDDRIYRVTVICNIYDGISFVIRQTPETIIHFQDLPLTTNLRRSVERQGATGLCLIAGEMGCGKTTTAASLLRHRIEFTAGLGVAVEDPVETMLNGRHGQGRCLQIEVGQYESYSSATKKAWRMGASCLLLGEIRDGQTAHEVLKASLSMFVVSTIHAASVFDAIERYVMFCEEINPNAKQNIANTLYIIGYQTMKPIIKDDLVIGRSVDINAYNLVNCNNHDSIKSKIAQGKFKSLIDDFNSIEYKF
ncbi:TPA: ATPase, T2SS/T4P/T4SS family [Citrobacter freundii]